jgi:hypothetical protein
MDSNPDANGQSILGMQMQGGELQRISPTATKEEQTATLNEIIDYLNNLLKSQVFADGVSKRYVQGYAPGRWPGGDFGIAISEEGDDVLDAEFDALIFAWDFTTNKQYIRGGTQYWYDPTTGKNHTQIGTLPNGKGGVSVAREGDEVEDAYTT